MLRACQQARQVARQNVEPKWQAQRAGRALVQAVTAPKCPTASSSAEVRQAHSTDFPAFSCVECADLRVLPGWNLTTKRDFSRLLPFLQLIVIK